MSVLKLSSNASGTGIFTIASPNSNTDRTLNLPDSSGTIATAESTLSQFNASGSAPVYACRAWVNFNGTGTVAISASGNVSSITDNGVGNYTVNFATAMTDANFAVNAITNSTTGDASRPIVAVRTGASTTTATIQTVGTFNNNTNVDCSVVAVTIHR